MRSRTNQFLAAVAFADIFFLLLMFPFSIRYNSYLRKMEFLNRLILYGNSHIIAFTNMCAFASIW